MGTARPAAAWTCALLCSEPHGWETAARGAGGVIGPGVGGPPPPFCACGVRAGAQVLPAEADFLTFQYTSERRWSEHHGVMEDLKAQAKAAGLWNLFLPRNHASLGGVGLTNLEYGACVCTCVCLSVCLQLFVHAGFGRVSFGAGSVCVCVCVGGGGGGGGG
jgi:hypothetical protein